MTRLTTKLEIAAAASAPSPSIAAAATHNVFHGPVGLVQTGPGSIGTVHQHLSAEFKTEVATALQVVLQQLDQPENKGLGNARELRELVMDAKAETEKATPNALKLGGSLRTIAESVRFVGSLSPAYHVLKPVLGFFGIHLP